MAGQQRRTLCGKLESLVIEYFLENNLQELQFYEWKILLDFKVEIGFNLF